MLSLYPVGDQDDLSMMYTPGVARVCNAIAADESLADEYTIRKNTVAIVSDGTAVLGLGNIGPVAGLPVMEGRRHCSTSWPVSPVSPCSSNPVAPRS